MEAWSKGRPFIDTIGRGVTILGTSSLIMGSMMDGGGRTSLNLPIQHEKRRLGPSMYASFFSETYYDEEVHIKFLYNITFHINWSYMLPI